MTVIIINNKTWLQDIFDALICNASKAKCKDDSHSSKVPWPLLSLFLVYTWKVLTFLCTRQDFSFAQRFEIQGPVANSKTSNQISPLMNFTDQDVQGPSGIDHNSVPLFCNFYSFVLLEGLPAAGVGQWRLLGSGVCLHLRIGRKNNSKINEMKVSPFNSPLPPS